MNDQSHSASDASYACLLFVPKTNESAGNLFDRPIFEIQFGRGTKPWLAPGLTPGEVGAEVPRGELPKAEWAQSLPGDPSLNISAQLPVRIALDIQYRAPRAARPPSHVYFTGQLVNDSLVDVGDVLVKGVFAATIQFRRMDHAAAPRDIVLIAPSVPALAADVENYRERWGKSAIRHNGLEWSVTIGLTQDGRLRVTFVPPSPTDTQPILLHVRFIAARNVEEVWGAIKAEGGVPVAPEPVTTPPIHRAPNPESGRWIMGIAFSVLLLSAAIGLHGVYTTANQPSANLESRATPNPSSNPTTTPSVEFSNEPIPPEPKEMMRKPRKERTKPVETPQLPPPTIEPPRPAQIFEIHCVEKQCVSAHSALAQELTQKGYSGSATLSPGEKPSLPQCRYAPAGQDPMDCDKQRKNQLIITLEDRGLDSW